LRLNNLTLRDNLSLGLEVQGLGLGLEQKSLGLSLETEVLVLVSKKSYLHHWHACSVVRV